MDTQDHAGALVLVLCKKQQRACAQHGNDAAYVDAVPASGAVMREPALLFHEFVLLPCEIIHQGHSFSVHIYGQQRSFCTLVTKGEASDLLILDADRSD